MPQLKLDEFFSTSKLNRSVLNHLRAGKPLPEQEFTEITECLNLKGKIKPLCIVVPNVHRETFLHVTLTYPGALPVITDGRIDFKTPWNIYEYSDLGSLVGDLLTLKYAPEIAVAYFENPPWCIPCYVYVSDCPVDVSRLPVIPEISRYCSLAGNAQIQAHFYLAKPPENKITITPLVMTTEIDGVHAIASTVELDLDTDCRYVIYITGLDNGIITLQRTQTLTDRIADAAVNALTLGGHVHPINILSPTGTLLPKKLTTAVLGMCKALGAARCLRGCPFKDCPYRGKSAPYYEAMLQTVIQENPELEDALRR